MVLNILKSQASLVWLVVCLVAFQQDANAKPRFTIGVISDLASSHYDQLQHRNVSELKALVENEFELKFINVQIDWSKDSFNRQIEKVYQNPKVDMVLVQGIAANQIVIRRKTFPKPTFLPFIVERELVQAPYKNGVSGVRNLSYLTYSTQFLESIQALREVVPFSKIALLSDEILMQALPPIVAQQAQANDGLTMELVDHDGLDNSLFERIPNDADAVMFGHLPRLSRLELKTLIRELTARKIPTFSYLEEGLIELGLLATPINETLYQYAARRNALNMQAVMLGEPASQQPVEVEAKSKLTINQATAEKLGVAIDFKVLVEAHVVGFGQTKQEQSYDLVDIAELALKQSLSLQDARFRVDIQSQEKQLAKGRLRPQLSVSASHLRRKDDSGAVLAGLAAKDSTDAALSISQTLFSDSEATNFRIQSLLLDASNSQLRQAQLDTIREASLAMADVLQAQAEAAIQQENSTFSDKNLELAKDRVSLGASSFADQYRWETQSANGKSAVFNSFSRVLIAQQNLNRVLHLPITEQIELKPLNMDELMAFNSDDAFKLVDNTASFERAYEFALQQTYLNSPEVQRLSFLIKAKQRELRLASRRSWMPDLSLSGQVSENLDRAGVSSIDTDGRDWQLMLNARLPFYRGGQNKSLKKRAALELQQLENQLTATREQLAQTLRASMNNLLTSLFNVRFSSSAASAAERSLALVTDAYNKGAVAIVDLLDAQTASVNANLAQVQASIGFFRSNIEMQRTVGRYEFLMSAAQKEAFRKETQNAISQPSPRQ